jgi:hypothetical protein
MEWLDVTFSVSGVSTNVLVPPLVALFFSFFCSLGGVSGAFLLLPFQMSVMGYVSPGVSATNFVFNITAIPGGVYRFAREGRLNLPLLAVLTLGTLPGVVIGYFVRVSYLPDPARFKLFAGCVLLWLAVRLGREALRRSPARSAQVPGLDMRTTRIGLARIGFSMGGQEYIIGTLPLFLLAFAVGIIGGIYGIGGGAIISPFLISVLGLPVYAVAGASLACTFLTSAIGVAVYGVLATPGSAALPDWPLGMLFGLGGFVGIYFGARLQRRVPQRFIKAVLALACGAVSYRYLVSPLIAKYVPW